MKCQLGFSWAMTEMLPHICALIRARQEIHVSSYVYNPSKAVPVPSPQLSRPCDLAAPAGRALREEQAQSWQDPEQSVSVAVSCSGRGWQRTPKSFFTSVLRMLQCFCWLPAGVRSTRPSVEGDTGSSVVLSGVFALPPSFPKKCLFWWEGCSLPGGAFRSGQHLGPLQGCQCPVEPAVGSGEGLA